MAIDVQHENLIPINKAPAHIPGRPHISCLYRWMNHKDRPLETIMIGGRRWTSVEAIGRFIAGCNAPGATGPVPTSARREREILAAERRLDAAGVTL
jgi:hypothetical protein